MKRQTSKGKCSFCKATFGKAGVARHLKACKERMLAEKSGEKTKLFHMVVEGGPEYWLHIEMPADATLHELDSFLRDIWLECCGHLSAFEIEGLSYACEPQEDFDDESMDVALEDVLAEGMKFEHQYDFGTTTELALKVLSEREGTAGDELVKVLARNEPPDIKCECGKPATQVCTQCVYEGGGWLCEECAGEHECGEDMLLPVVNSPRCGVCGYTG